MYVNKCIKCGTEFETKNPKRVICPNCLYPEKKSGDDSGESQQQENSQQESPQQDENLKESGQSYRSENGYYSAGGYSYGGNDRSYQQRGGYQDRSQGQGGYQPRGGYQDRSQGQGGYQPRGGYQDRSQGQGGYQPRGGYQDRSQGQGGYQSRGGYQDRSQGQGGYQSRGGYQDRSQGGYQSRGGYQDRSQGGYSAGGSRPPQRRPFSSAPRPQKQLLISKEQLEKIEEFYRAMLPLPNPDAHEVIGTKLELEPRKVFFGINLIRQKMMLPKLPFPKRKLAISPDQLLAIRTLYEPLMPLPPIGCHKIIAVQLRIDEWRVHVGIGLIRAQMGLDRWNENREDAPAEFKKQSKTKKTDEDSDVAVEEKPKKTRAKKVVEDADVAVDEKPKKTRAKKTKTDDKIE